MTEIFKEWIQEFGPYGGALALVIQFFYVIWKTLKIGKLEIRLTREVFHRVSNLGESIFCNAILLAKNTSVLVLDAKFVLEKMDAPQKKYDLSFVYVGEKRVGSNNFADHFFYSQSPLNHVVVDAPERPIFFVALSANKAALGQIFSDFDDAILILKNAHGITGNEPTRTPEEVAAILAEFEKHIEKFSTDIFDCVEVEQGKYKLTSTLKYDAGFFVKRNSSSSIEFEIGDIRLIQKEKIKSLLRTLGNNHIASASVLPVYPEITPFNVKELDG